MDDVIPEFYYGALRLDAYPYAVVRDEGGLDLGSADKVMEIIDSLMSNGDITLSSKTGNRTIVIPLLIEGATLGELAANEAALQLECDKDYNEFTLVPGDGFGAPTVFDTFAANARHARDDRHEAAFARRWDLEIPAFPWPKSAESTTAVAAFDASPASLYERGFTLAVAGAMPTEASLHVSVETGSLGDTMVYTCSPDYPTYAPDLRRYASAATAAAATPDAGAVSGKINNSASDWVAEIPAANLPPGSYVIWARLRSPSPELNGVSWVAQTFVSGTIVPGSGTSGGAFPALSTEWDIFPIGRATLSTTPVSPSTPAVVRVTIDGASALEIDEVWAFNSSIGSLTAVSDAPLNLWLDAPTLARPLPTIWRGAAADKSTAYGVGAGVLAWGRHDLRPKAARGFLVTTGAQSASLTMSHRPRWPYYAAD